MNAEPPRTRDAAAADAAGVDRVVRRCLAKDPDERWQTAHDVADELRWMRETSGAGALVEIQSRRRGERRLAWPVAVVALVLAVVATTVAAVVWTRSPREPPPAGARPVLLSDRLVTAAEADPQRLFAVSRDGQHVAFVAERDGVPCAVPAGAAGAAGDRHPRHRERDAAVLLAGRAADWLLRRRQVEGGVARGRSARGSGADSTGRAAAPGRRTTRSSSHRQTTAACGRCRRPAEP